MKGPSRSVKYQTSRLVWNYAEADWERGCQLIRAFDWNTLLSNDINAAWINWHHMFINIMDKDIPQVILSPRRNLPWMSAAIIKAIKKRDSFFKKEGVTPRFKSARNRVTSLLRKAKRQYFHRIKSSEPKKFWKFVKALSKNRSSIPALDILYESDKQKAAVLNSFFSCFNLSHPPLDPSFPEDHLSVPNCEALYCMTEEVLHMLEHLDCSKACGPDLISARMLKVTASSIAPSITKLFNISIRTGKLPDQWKLSMVVPIPKSSNLSEPSNYRPISLLCILGKLLEKHISNLILESLENSSFDLSAQQWGFRSGRSTVSALLSVTHDWHATLEQGQEACAVFFDYQKAFDSVPHRPLLSKLESLQLDNVILKWLTDYLSGRSQFVVVSGAKSLPSPVLSGVPQGSILGPLLFLIYIDDLSHVNLLSSPRLHMFADDVLLYQVIDSVKDFVSVQENINTIWEWSQQNALTLNPTKCKFMMILRKKNSLLPPAPLHMGGQLLECVNSYKYLRVHLSSDLSWSNHTQHVCVKAKKLIGLIYRNFYNHIPQNMLLKLYKSLVRPHTWNMLLQYGVLTYSATKNSWKELKNLHCAWLLSAGILATWNYWT